MLVHRSRAFAAWVVVPGVALLLASSASAQSSTCGSDADCERGYRCDVIGYVDCASAPCAPGEKCPVVEEGCGELKACVPGAACQSDADCGDAMVCYEHTRMTCTGGDRPEPCRAGEGCADPEPVAPECVERTEKGCLPKYVPPCSTDGDCGEGFRCVEQQSCGCSGSPGRDAPPPVPAGASGGASDDVSAPEDCSCEPSGTFHCESAVDRCAADGECPADWTCEDQGTVSGCASAPPARPGDPEESPVCDTEPVVTHDFRCTAPVFSGYGGPTRDGLDDFDEGAKAPGSGRGGGAQSDGGCTWGAGRVSPESAGYFGALAALGLLVRRVHRRARR